MRVPRGGQPGWGWMPLPAPAALGWGFLRGGTRFPSENPPAPGNPRLHMRGTGREAEASWFFLETEAWWRTEPGSAFARLREVAGTRLRQRHRPLPVPWRRGRAGIQGDTRTPLGSRPPRRLGPPSAFLHSPLGTGWGICPAALGGILGDRTLRSGDTEGSASRSVEGTFRHCDHRSGHPRSLPSPPNVPVCRLYRVGGRSPSSGLPVPGSCHFSFGGAVKRNLLFLFISAKARQRGLPR